MQRLLGRSALITGAAGGIGSAIAERFAAEGAQLLLTDASGDRLETVSNALRRSGASIWAIAADLTAEPAPTSLIEAAQAKLGGLDILVNNAGVASFGWVESVASAEYERVMAVNVRSVFRLTQAATPTLKESRYGRIINLSSVEGIRGSGLLPLYCASKHAVVGLTRATAVKLGRAGVTVNAICPGPIETDMLRPFLSDRRRERLAKRIPLNRIGHPREVAGVAAFLASDDAAFVNGHTLVVDGGMTANA